MEGSDTKVQAAYQFGNFIMKWWSLVIEVIIEHRRDARVGEYICISLKDHQIIHVSIRQWSTKKITESWYKTNDSVSDYVDEKKSNFRSVIHNLLKLLHMKLNFMRL